MEEQSRRRNQQGTASAQSRAEAWFDNDRQRYTYEDEKRDQRLALATFYYSTGGDNWENNTNWLSYDVDEVQKLFSGVPAAPNAMLVVSLVYILVILFLLVRMVFESRTGLR